MRPLPRLPDLFSILKHTITSPRALEVSTELSARCLQTADTALQVPGHCRSAKKPAVHVLTLFVGAGESPGSTRSSRCPRPCTRKPGLWGSSTPRELEVPTPSLPGGKLSSPEPNLRSPVTSPT
ncbi:uncharacterized protein LOC115295623 isoform X2 [Suricata suricatta]|uniref:uncharacterized protein LOC115295623 isoform X2 n=1 Tax=Suricata suricatta TaxID=37032 RepID=UPI001155E3BF|nr:uncharacterized protein LOC115295623 isoform X2 [Suricata suricatta]